MRSSSTEAQFCPNPKIIAGRLIAMRNIYLREELRNIAKGIQEHYQERLPVLPLVSLAAYEQIFQRQPLCLPEEHRRDAVKYGLEYYKFHMEKLRTAEADNGLGPAHDRLSDVHENSSSHQTNSSVSNSSQSSITTRESGSTGTSSRENIPKIMISRTSDSGSDSDNSSTTDDDQTSTDTDFLTVP